MSEPRVSEQDILALVKRYGVACAGKALHNGPGQQISCDIALSAVQDALAAARQAAEQRAERLAEELAAWRSADDELRRPSYEHVPDYYARARYLRAANEAAEREHGKNF